VIGIEHYVGVSAILFVLGVLGIFLNRKNVIVILMAIELILLAVNLNLVAFSAFLHDLTGQIFAMFVLTVAAGEASRWAVRLPVPGPISNTRSPGAISACFTMFATTSGFTRRCWPSCLRICRRCERSPLVAKRTGGGDSSRTVRAA
jgi:NADH-quinone oxidoreductase subunit K